MKRLDVLVAAMNQRDLSLYKRMNLQSDAVIANLGQEENEMIAMVGDYRVHMITTSKTGVSNNRNLALEVSDREICLLSDEDMVYVDGYREMVLEAFDSLPQADLIIFNIEVKHPREKHRINRQIGRVRFFRFLNYGAVRIAFRRDRVNRHHLRFSTLFGPGAQFGAGEDTLFLREAIKNRLKIFTHPAVIASTTQAESSWFTGYSETFFYDKGAFFQAAFPVLKAVLMPYYAFRFSRKSSMNFVQSYRWMIRGAKSFRKMTCQTECRESLPGED